MIVDRPGHTVGIGSPSRGVIMGYIELGVPEVEEPDAEALPVREAWRRRPRWLVPVLVVLATLLTCAAAVRPADPAVREVLTGVRLWSPDRSALVVGDAVYVVRPGPNGVWLDRYDILRGGRPVWQRRAADVGAHVELDAVPGLVLATEVIPGQGDIATALVHTTALDPATGAARWRHAGHPLPARTAAELVFADSAGYGDDATFAAVDGRTGRELWRWGLHGRVATAVAADPAGYPTHPVRIATLARPGILEMVDPAAGRVMGRHPVPMDPGADPMAQSLSFTDRVFLDIDGLDLAFDGRTFAPLWSVRNATVQPPGAGRHWLVPCGGAVCSAGDDGLVAVDPATGARLWETGAFGVGMLGRWVALNAGADDLTLVESRTGRPVGSLREWQPL